MSEEKEIKDLLSKYGFKPEEFKAGAWFNPSTFLTGYPKPFRIHHCIIDTHKSNVEENFYWLVNHAKFDFGYIHTEKIIDMSAQSEQSSTFGNVQQRLGIQQDRVTQYLATIGKFIKEMFQMVRELRVIDEKLEHYRKSIEYGYKRENPFEITLKGNWIDLVDGGTKSPASVYGMARDLQFTSLPDLFFAAPPFKSENDVQKYVESLEGFNESVKRVLMRKLGTFVVWKRHTEKELQDRRIFMISYLRQHFEIIKMYIGWVKPYLRNIRRLQSRTKYMDSADMVSGFESSMMEIEILQKKKMPDSNGVWAVILQSFIYKSSPSLTYQSEGYQRGPMHAGEVRMYMRSYAWTDAEIYAYKKMREEEDLKMIGVIDQSLQAAMEALGDDLMNYLKESEDRMPDLAKDRPKEKKDESPKEKDEPKGDNVLTPFIGVAKGFGELFGYETTGAKKAKKKDEEPKDLSKMSDKELAELIKSQNEDEKIKKKKGDIQSKQLNFTMYTVYKNFKKTHGMMAWR